LNDAGKEFIVWVRIVTTSDRGRTMNKNPLQDLANRIGMYAYLTAIGGLRYWPALRDADIEEETLSIWPAMRSTERDETAAREYEREEKISA